MGTIPVSQIISVTPSVLQAGGNSLTLNGLILSQNAALPVGAPVGFPTAASVSAYFGATSQEAAMAAVYFSGWTNSPKKPAALLFARYASTACAGFLRGGPVPNLTLAQVQAVTAGQMSVTVDGTVKASSTISLATATSMSDAAAKLTTALALSGGAAVTYSSQFNAFVITSGTTGANSTIASLSSTSGLDALLGLSTAAGAITSPGSAAMTPAAAMAALIAQTTNWACFTSAFEPVTADKQAFSTWTSQQSGQFLYVPWDTDITATQNPGSFAGLGNWLVLNSIGGVAPVYKDPLHAAFILGCAASIDYERTNGRIDFSFKTGSGIAASVTDATSAANLKANGYNYYGAYATAAQQWNILYPGQVSGPYKSIGAYVDAIWLNSALQLAEMNMFANVNSVPYDALGYGLIEAAASDPIHQAILNGVISQGVPLSTTEVAEVNAQAGVKIDTTLSTRGWYLQVLSASATARAARSTPPCTFWYTGASGITQLNLASVDVQ